MEHADGKKVVIAVPCMDDVKAFFAHDLAQLMWYTSRAVTNPFGPLEAVGLLTQAGTYAHAARQKLYEAARDLGDFDYILFLDSDMRFPQDALERLLKHDVDMVGVNYSARVMPPRPIAIKSRSGDGALLHTLDDSTGLEDVDAMGFGCVLIRREVFNELEELWPNSFHWDFDTEYRKGERVLVGEDVFFCNRVREAGFTMWIDHDLSKDVRHLGQYEYSLDLVNNFIGTVDRLREKADV